MKATVAIFLADGFEEIEALTVVDLLRRSMIDIRMVSVTGKKQVVSSHKITVEADALLEEMDYSETEMLVLPGGMPGTRNLENTEALSRLIDEFYSKGKKIAAICAAPSILGHKGILQGRNACSFPEFESELTGANVSKREVEVSDNIITARGMGCAIPFGLAIVESFLGTEKMLALKTKIVYEQR